MEVRDYVGLGEKMVLKCKEAGWEAVHLII
jgi:hypothetical protein